MGSMLSRTLYPNPSPNSGPTRQEKSVDSESYSPVEWESHSTAGSSSAFRSPNPIELPVPVNPDPLDPTSPSTTKVDRPVEYLHKRLSQSAVSQRQETFSHCDYTSARDLHSLRDSLDGSYKDTDVGVLPCVVYPTDHSEGSHFPDEFLSVNHTEEHHGFQAQIDAKFTSDQLVKQLEDVSTKRLQVREMRIGLHYKREEETKYRLALMKKLNSLLAQDRSLDIRSITQDVEQLQSATEAYLELEQSYQQKESELGQNEYLLIQSIERFSSRLQNTSSSIQGDDMDVQDITLEDDDASVQGVPSKFPPAVVDYLSRVGDARMLQERLADLDSQWHEIIDKRKMRLSLNVPMDDDSLEFLHSYDALRLQIRDELNEIMADVTNLRAICQDQGLLTEEYIGDLDYLHENDLGDTTVQFDDPLKTSAVDDFSPFYESGSTKLPRDMFINKWILHQLRHSSIEISRFKSTPEIRRLSQQGLDGANISQLALMVWYSDDTVKSPMPPLSEDDYIYARNTDNSNKVVEHGLDNQKMVGLSLLELRSEPGVIPKESKDLMIEDIRALSL